MKGYVTFVQVNKIEDENHFLLDCKACSQIRDTFFSKLETKIADFKSLSHDTLICGRGVRESFIIVSFDESLSK